MSRLLYIASDSPLPPRPNPHERVLSINEALALGFVKIPEELLASGIDRDKPLLLWMDREVNCNVDTGTIEDGGFDDDFGLFPAEGYEDVYTEKRYAAALEWNAWTEGRARNVIAYIRENLCHTDEAEIWNIWMGYGERPIIRSKTIPIDKLLPEDLKALTEQTDMSTVIGDCEIPIQYRIVMKA